jgi:hypothetical protein
VVFGDLSSIEYYVDARAQNYNNWQIRDANPYWVTTHRILPEKVQWFIAFVDYVEYIDGSGNVVRDKKNMTIRKIERKAAGKTYNGVCSGEIDYESLLKKVAN